MKIGDLIPDYIRTMGIARGLVGNTVCTAFDKVLDGRFSKYLISREFNNGKLYCTMSSSVARDSLSMHKGKMIEEINSVIGEDVLKEIIFR
ncbi:MAG: DciA family protein [Bacteroidales bacterium]|jgi:hypothetical protein|nr:DciA family protein [Bacteroidales bacterium]